MNNIFNVWSQYYNSNEKDLYQNKDLHQFSKSWGDQEYPGGEDWKYVNFSSIKNMKLDLPVTEVANRASSTEGQILIEVNDFNCTLPLDSGVLPTGFNVESLDKTHAPKRVVQNPNPFIGVNSSFVGVGLNLEFSGEYNSGNPVKVVINLDQFSKADSFVPFTLNIKSQAKVCPKIYIETMGLSFSGLSNILVNVELDKASHLKVFSKEIGGLRSHFVFNLNATVPRDAKFSLLDMTFPSVWSRHNVNANLQDTAAETSLKGGYFNGGSNFVDHHTTICHEIGHTESSEDYRGVLGGKARAVFNGKVIINKDAAKSNSEQINKNLMLSKSAEIDTKPELQIYNDDVKAAHGATIGQLDEEQAFYLQSRGFGEEQAKEFLAKAFVFDLLEDESDLTRSFYRNEMLDAIRAIGEKSEL